MREMQTRASRFCLTRLDAMLKRKGLLVSVFINATTIRAEHIALFKKYPTRDIEITVCTDGLMAMPRAMPKFARNT